MMLIVEKDIRAEMYHAIHSFAKANNKYMNDYDPTENYHTSCTGMSTTYMDG